MEIFSKQCVGFWATISVENAADGTFNWYLRLSPYSGDTQGYVVLEGSGHPRSEDACTEALEALDLLDSAADSQYGDPVPPRPRPAYPTLH